jgi:MFS family permease
LHHRDLQRHLLLKEKSRKLEIKKLLGNFKFSHFETGVWIAITVRFLGMFSFAIYGPFFLLYLSQTRGLTMTAAGMVVAISSLANAASQALGGVVTDRFGRRKSMVFFSMLDVLFNIALTFMIAVSTPVWSIAIVYFVEGFIVGMKQPATTAIIIDLAPRQRLTEAYGLAQIVANIGWIIGPLLGGFMFSSFSYAYLFAIAVLTSIACLILTLAALKESYTGTKGESSFHAAFSIKADRALFTYIGLNLMVFIVYVQIVNMYSVFVVNELGFTATQYGLLLTIASAFAVIFQYPVTRMVAMRMGDKNALFLGSFIFGLGYLSLGWITSFAWSVVAILVITLGELLFVPSASSTVGRLAAPDQRGRYMGLLGAGSGLGIAIGPLLGGVLFDVTSGAPPLMWGAFAAIAFLAGLGFLRWFQAYKNRII